MSTLSIRRPRSAHQRRVELYTGPHPHLVQPGWENAAPRHDPLAVRSGAGLSPHPHELEPAWTSNKSGLERRFSRRCRQTQQHQPGAQRFKADAQLCPALAEKSQPKFPALLCVSPSVRAPKPPHTPSKRPKAATPRSIAEIIQR